MTNNLEFKIIDKETITEEQFDQIIEVEQSDTESAYSDYILQRIYLLENNINFACFDKGKIIAHMATDPNFKRRNDSIYIINIVVLDKYRRQGIAQKLIHTACKYYLENDSNSIISLNVDKDNIAAINLYKKLGFKNRKPISEIDADDEQYMMDVKVSKLDKILTKLANKKRGIR